MAQVDIEQKLLNLKTKVNKAESDRDKTEAVLKTHLRRLETDFGCKDVTEATQKLKSTQKKCDLLEDQITKEISEIEAVLEKINAR
jgi:hypothetical protein